MTPEDEIKKIEEEIQKTPYNKATQKHIGMLKAKLARLRTSAEKKSGKAGAGYSVRKSGDATVLLVGFPSVGKSTLLNELTNADSKIGEYDFTTLNIIPGMLEYNGAKIQLLDIPGMVADASSGKGKGKEILSVIRNADLILIMIDAKNLEQCETIERELYSAGFRLNQKSPDIKIFKKNRGGIKVESTLKLTKLSHETIKTVLREFKINNAEILIRDDISLDELIDCLMKSRLYVPCLFLANKIDLVDEKQIEKIRKENFVFISALKKTNIDFLKELIWQKLGLMRIYMKRIGKKADMKTPLIVVKNSNVSDICAKIHKDFLRNFKFARIWGPSSDFDGQKVGLEHKLQDEDVVELHVE